MKGYLTIVVYAGLAVAAGAALVSGAHAQGVVSEWSQVQAPPAPELHQVTVEPARTALLLMDFGQANCSREPRCAADIPHIKMLLDQARSHNVFVVYTGFTGLTVMMSEIAPQAGEPTVLGRGNKFYNTNLDGILKQHGINTVIACGTSANGAVLFTAAGATARGYHVIVPVDCMPGRSAYAEQTVVWGVANDPGLEPPQAFGGGRAGRAARGAGAGRPAGPPPGYATLTSSDMIHFG